MNGYPPISEHGLIGDLQTAALVATDGTVDWFCVPRFDSPSVFASLLDAERGGRFRIAPEGTEYVSKQLYFPDTAILITRFMTPDGVGEVVDFMPVDAPEHASAHHELVRIVRVVRGQMTFVLECEPRFDYGRAKHDLTRTEDGVIFRSDGFDLALRSTVALEPNGSDVRATWTARAGEVAGAVLESAPSRDTSPSIDPRSRARDVQSDGPVLAELARPLDLRRTMARSHPSIGDGAEAHDVCADRRIGRRSYNQPP